jgi:transcription-repair coupling factor (superfamily II helicase)
MTVAEKLAHLEHQEWVKARKQASERLAKRALELLDKAANNPTEPGDQLISARSTR